MSMGTARDLCQLEFSVPTDGTDRKDSSSWDYDVSFRVVFQLFFTEFFLSFLVLVSLRILLFSFQLYYLRARLIKSQQLN